MSDIIIKPVLALKEISDCGIMIINAHKKPPHLAFYSKDKYYSLSVKGLNIGSNLSKTIDKLKRKKVPVIFITLDIHFTEAEIENSFNKYKSLDSGISCLYPIKNLFRKHINSYKDINYIFDLIPLLRDINLIKQYSHINANNYISNKTFTLKTYSMEDIMNEISNLKK